MRWHFFMLLTVGLLIAADAPNDTAKQELHNFQGTWILVSAEMDGKKVPGDKGIKLQIIGTKYILSQESSAVIGHKGTFSLDPAKKPKATDVAVTEGPDKGKTFMGIYQLSNDDYKVCFATAGKERPQEFSSKPGSGNILQVWKREKKND